MNHHNLYILNHSLIIMKKAKEESKIYTTISITYEVWKKLTLLKDIGDTYDDVIDKLIREHKKYKSRIF